LLWIVLLAHTGSFTFIQQPWTLTGFLSPSLHHHLSLICLLHLTWPDIISSFSLIREKGETICSNRTCFQRRWKEIFGESGSLLSLFYLSRWWFELFARCSTVTLNDSANVIHTHFLSHFRSLFLALRVFSRCLVIQLEKRENEVMGRKLHHRENWRVEESTDEPQVYRKSNSGVTPMREKSVCPLHHLLNTDVMLHLRSQCEKWIPSLSLWMVSASPLVHSLLNFFASPFLPDQVLLITSLYGRPSLIPRLSLSDSHFLVIVLLRDVLHVTQVILLKQHILCLIESCERRSWEREESP
jgi:hypothetical protein